jgi:nucleotide-binding universal stress UspA family protein
MRRILFPVDFSSRSEHIAPLVAAVARRMGADVHLMHVLSYTPEIYGAMEYVGQAADLLSPETLEKWRCDKLRKLERFLPETWNGLNTPRSVEAGEISESIVEKARADSADLIMMPTHGYGPFRRMLLGSVTAKVLHDAPCPVWTDAHADSPGAWRPETPENILCAVDLEDDAFCIHVIKGAAEFAKPFGAKVAVLHAMPSVGHHPGIPDAPGDIVRVSEDRLWELVYRAGATAQVHIEGGWPVEALHRFTREHRPDLLVIGRSRHRGIGRLGSHAYAMIREAPCPVLSIL